MSVFNVLVSQTWTATAGQQLYTPTGASGYFGNIAAPTISNNQYTYMWILVIVNLLV